MLVDANRAGCGAKGWGSQMSAKPRKAACKRERKQVQTGWFWPDQTRQVSPRVLMETVWVPSPLEPGR